MLLYLCVAEEYAVWNVTLLVLFMLVDVYMCSL